jgi:O-antigen ligase
LLIGVPASLLALGLAQRERRATWIAVVAVAVVGLLVLPLAGTERFRSVLNLTAGTAFFRLKLWRSTLRMVADHPLTGVGMDQFLYAYRSRYVLPSAWGELDLSHPHNLILDAWTRLGLPGLAAVGWLFVTLLRTIWHQLRTATGDRRALLLGLFAATVAILAHGTVDHAVFVIDLSFVLSLILAMSHP